MGLVGANGSGKTTTIKCALGMVHPDAGSVSIVAKERIGVVLDQVPYPQDWTIGKLARGIAPFYEHWDDAGFARLLAEAGMKPSLVIKGLSRGMAVRLQLAVAFSHGAELLVLDEPTSGLDPFARDEFVQLIAAFMAEENHSVLFSTHITTDLERVADYVTVLSHGRVVASSTTDDLLDGYRMVRGRPADLSPDLASVAIGLRTHATGWDALVPTEETASLPAGAIAERPTIDDVVVRTTKEEHHG